MNILIISSCELPIPATKGGAVETLITSIIKQNEKTKNKIYVIGKYEKEADDIAQKYNNCFFEFQKSNKIIELMDNLYEKIYKILTGREHKILKRYLWKLILINRIKKCLSKNSFDKIVIENAGFLLNSLNNKKILKKYEGKIYYHLHNDIPNNLNKKILKECKLILVSKYLKNKINTNYKECVKDENIFILKNGFNTNLFTKTITTEEKMKIKEDLNIPKDKKVIIFTGRINKEKGINELVDAFIDLKSDEFILLIVGSNSFGTKRKYFFETKLQEKIKNVEDKIRFTGFVEYGKIWKYYKASDIAVLPSVWNEPAGLTMLESLASGIPLITTKSGGIPEYIYATEMIQLEKDEYLINNISKSIQEVNDKYELYYEKASKASKFIEKTYNEKVFYDNFIKIMEGNIYEKDI